MWFLYGFIGLVCIGFILYYFDDVRYTYYENKLKQSTSKSIITQDSLQHLPKQIQTYLQLVGVVGKEIPKGMKLRISGQMKPNKKVHFADAKAKQTSLFSPYSRYFLMVLKMRGVKVKGFHIFHHAKAIMKIKVLGIFRVVNGKGKKMNQAETVTVFNDICLFAPHALIEANVVYKEVDDYILDASFVNEGIEVGARLVFDDEGKLINFISDDRYFSQDGEEQISAPWATPVHEYKEQNGFYLPYKGDAIWQFEDEDFTYFKLTLEDVKYIS
ncbi:MAG: DUF6544 family protein [Candidatus Izemoplasmataceae bacterium]